MTETVEAGSATEASNIHEVASIQVPSAPSETTTIGEEVNNGHVTTTETDQKFPKEEIQVETVTKTDDTASDAHLTSPSSEVKSQNAEIDVVNGEESPVKSEAPEPEAADQVANLVPVNDTTATKVAEGVPRTDVTSIPPTETVGKLNAWGAKQVSGTMQMLFERETDDGSIKLDRPKEAFTVTEDMKSADLKSLPVETVGSLAGWTAKRVSITGQIFFERDADGKIALERPKEALDAVKQADDESDDTDVENDVPKTSSSKQPLADMDTINSNTSSPTSPSTTPNGVDNTNIATRPASVQKPKPVITTNLPVLPEKPAPIPPEILAQIQAMEGNGRCADCGASAPTWASVSFGVLLCMGCSGQHRAFGTHISVVKSLKLDNWTSEQIAYLYPNGGNAKFKHTVKSEGKQSARYKTDEAAMYRARLRALVKNEPVPDKVDPLDAERPGSNVSNPPPSPMARSTRSLQSMQDSRDASSCQLCGKQFSVVARKHFCRNCERAVCSRCAPAANSKPLPQLGLGMAPMRHCSKCYRSPFIDWSSVGLTSAEQAAEASISADASSPTGPTLARRKTMTRRKTMNDPKKQAPQRRKTLGQTLAGLIKRG